MKKNITQTYIKACEKLISAPHDEILKMTKKITHTFKFKP
jgi:hypothetical protein